jgi:hypothetical protein
MSGVPLYNAAKLAAVRNVEGNSEKGQLIGQYMAAITTLKEEYANFAQGGYAPTESAFKLGDALIKENYGSNYMKATLEETRRLVNIRREAFKNVQAQKVAGPAGLVTESGPPAAGVANYPKVASEIADTLPIGKATKIGGKVVGKFNDGLYYINPRGEKIGRYTP